MGSCISKHRGAIHPTSLHQDLPRPFERADKEQSTSSASPQKDDKAPSKIIDSTVPDTFFPKSCGVSREKECELTYGKIRLKETEKPLRHRVEELLMQWRQCGIIGEIESHALSINALQATSVQQLACSLANSEAKYVKSLLYHFDSFCLIIAQAYAIYFWIANNIQYSQSMWMSFTSNPEKIKSKTNAEAVLKSRKGISIGYANLFHAIATHIGLTTQTVEGSLKLTKIQSAQGSSKEFVPQDLNLHFWNVVSNYQKCVFNVEVLSIKERNILAHVQFFFTFVL